MSVIRHFQEGMEPLGACAMAIGVFDGVHIGHRTLVRDTVTRAHERGHGACVVTFDRDPECIVQRDRFCAQLTTLDDKLALLAQEKPDHVLVLPFDRHMAALEPEAFLADVLLHAGQPTLIAVGHDFRFGARASGDVTTLQRFCDPEGIEVVPHGLVTAGGSPVTATRIRELIAGGEVAEARTLLDRPHWLHGTVTRGRGVGADLGFPTANIDVDPVMARPSDGVYAAEVVVGERSYLAGVTVGSAPSFTNAPDAIEAHLIGFAGDLYGHDIRVSFLRRLHALRRFDDLPSLAAAIADDLGVIRASAHRDGASVEALERSAG